MTSHGRPPWDPAPAVPPAFSAPAPPLAPMLPEVPLLDLPGAVMRAGRAEAEIKSETPLNRILVLPLKDGQQRRVLVSTLAREIVLYGDSLEAVADAYGMAIETLQELVERNPLLGTEVDAARKELGSATRMEQRFRDLVDSEFYILAETIRGTKTTPETKLKAFQLAAEFAGMGGKKNSSPAQAPQPVNILVAGVNMPALRAAKVVDATTAQRMVEEAEGTDDGGQALEDIMAAQTGLPSEDEGGYDA